MQLFAAAGGFGDSLFGEVGALLGRLDEILEFGAGTVEDPQIIVEILEQRFDGLLDLAVQAVIAVGFLRPAHARLCHGVEQLPCRMGLLREQVLVEQRHLEERDLQASEQGLHLRRQVAVLQDELEQHADQIDSVLVDAGDMRLVVAMELAGLIEQFLLDLLHHLRRIRAGEGVRLRRGRLVLQQGECGQQLGWRDAGHTGQVMVGGAAALKRDAAVGQQRTHGVVDLDLQLRGGGFVRRRVGLNPCAATGGRRFRRGCRPGHTLRAGRQGIANMRQHSGLDQLLVDLVVDRIQAGHYVAVEQLEDDQPRVDAQIQLAHRQPECLTQMRRCDRVGGVIDIRAAADHRQALVHRVQRRCEATLRLGNSAGDGEGFFQLRVVQQGEVATAALS